MKTLNRIWTNTQAKWHLSDVFRTFTLRLRQKELSKLLSLEILEPEGKKITTRHGGALIDLCSHKSRSLHLTAYLNLKKRKIKKKKLSCICSEIRQQKSKAALLKKYIFFLFLHRGIRRPLTDSIRAMESILMHCQYLLTTHFLQTLFCRCVLPTHTTRSCRQKTLKFCSKRYWIITCKV